MRDMTAFLDEMDFSYYDSGAMMYLVMDNGIIISRLSHPNASPAFNLSMVIGDKTIKSLDNESDVNDMYTSDKVRAFLMTGPDEKQYIISIPIDTGSMPLRIFYVEKENVINKSTNSFSNQLVMFSVVVIVMFTAVAFTVYISFFSSVCIVLSSKITPPTS